MNFVEIFLIFYNTKAAIFVHRFSANISVENRETLGNSIVEIQKIENTKLIKKVTDRVPFYPEKLSDSTVISKLI